MSETHINGYVADVVEARDGVVRALGQFEAATERLKAQEGFDKNMLVELPFTVVYPEASKAPAKDPKASTSAPA